MHAHVETGTLQYMARHPEDLAEYARRVMLHLVDTIGQGPAAKALGRDQSTISRVKATGKTTPETLIAAVKLAGWDVGEAYELLGMPVPTEHADVTADPWERAGRAFLALGGAEDREQRLTFIDWLRESAFAGLPMRTADDVMATMLSQWGPWRAMERGKRAGVTELTED